MQWTWHDPYRGHCDLWPGDRISIGGILGKGTMNAPSNASKINESTL
jgi:hypothetical protein